MTTHLFKAVRPDGLTRNGLDWNVPEGTVIRADHTVSDLDHGGVCLQREGDGISIAKTWWGAAQAGHPTVRCCTVTVDPADILAEDADKMRVRQVTVGVWFDAAEMLRAGCGAGADLLGANLRRADLAGADLRRADLRRADLRHADLAGADLTGADLRRANLAGANLTDADLYGANLTNANLTYTNLRRANLAGAYLAGAYLTGADLRRANLAGADLRRANLAGANLGDWERGPDGYAQRKETT